MKEFEKKGSPSREGLSKFLPASMSDASARRRLTEYEIQVQDLQAYVPLPREARRVHLRKKLEDTPKEFMIIENKLREANRQLVQAFNQNEKLVNALYEAREQITALKEEVDKLCAPPSTYGVYLSPNEDGDRQHPVAGPQGEGQPPSRRSRRRRSSPGRSSSSTRGSTSSKRRATRSRATSSSSRSSSTTSARSSRCAPTRRRSASSPIRCACTG